LLIKVLQPSISDAETINIIVIIILSPIWGFLIFLIILGGYGLIIDDIDLIDLLKNHFRRQFIKSKVLGFSLIIIGLFMLFLPLIYLETSIWQSGFLMVSLVAYFLGAICLVIPKGSERKINKIIRNLKNRGKT